MVQVAPTKTSSATSAADQAQQAVRFLEARIQRDPDDFIAHNKLAAIYLQYLRETGDSRYLNLAADAVKASLNIIPAEHNKGGLIGLTQVEFASHHFAAARRHAETLVALAPEEAYGHQFLGDALLELGQYPQAQTAYQDMQRHAGQQGLTRAALEQRLARLAWLRGDSSAAQKHFSQALALAIVVLAPAETIAWIQWQLGETAFAIGDYPAAEQHMRDSLVTLPNAPRALAALGRVRYALGDMANAIALFEQAVLIQPDLSFVSSLGDLYQLAGRSQDAAQQYALVEHIGQLSALNGPLHSRQLALYYADHDLKPAQALALAREEYAARSDIYGADALAWTALKAGKIEVAQAAMQDALKLGTQDAKLFYHAGMIARQANDRALAQHYLTMALRLNPAFDALQAQQARLALRSLDES